MAESKEFSIKLNNLKNGENKFHYSIDNELLTKFESDLMENLNAEAELVLIKENTELEAIFVIKGVMTLLCDRCLQPFLFSFESNERVLYIFTYKSQENEEDEVFYLPPETTFIDFSQDIYDFICMQIPFKKLPEGCPGEICPPEVIKVLNLDKPEGEEDSEKEIDPRWAKLKDLKNKGEK